MARLVVSAAAAVVVGYFFGPVAGFQTFAAVYGVTGFLDPNKKVLGPKLTDLKMPQASYGAPIPYIEGAPRLAGNVIWATDKRAISNTQTQGKGGPGVDTTTYTYEMDMMVELAINECAGVRRVWSNGKLIYSIAENASNETIAASNTTAHWRDFRFYGGAPTQLPDPTYEAAVGIGNAPAYRGRTTVVIEGLNLGPSGQLPVLTFEVLSEGLVTADVEQFTAIEGEIPFVIGTPAFSLGGFKVFVGSTVNTGAGTMTTADLYQVSAAGAASLLGTYDTGTHGYDTMGGNTDESLIALPEASAFLAPIDYYDFLFEDLSTSRLDTSFWGLSQVTFSKRGDDIVLVSITAGVSIDRKVRRYNRAGLLQQTSADLPDVCQSIAIGGSFVYVLSSDGDTVYQLALASLALIATIAVPANYTVLQGQIACDTDGTLYALGNGSPSFPTPLIRWDGTAWDLVAYGTEIGLLRADPTNSDQLGFSDGTPFSLKFDSSGSAPYHYRIRYMASRLSIVEPTLDQVVRRLCLRTGQLEDADIDVTDLAADIVRALPLTQVATTRNALELLMGAYLFEGVEGEKLRFVKRGQAPAMTITYDDLCAGADGAGEPFARKRTNDIEVAARVSVKYANVLNDFQDGLEQADRLVTESTGDMIVELVIGLTPTEARRIAEMNTMDLAVSLLSIGPISLPRKYAELEPTDVILLVDPEGSTFRARIVKGTIGGGVYTFDLVLDDATAIVSAAVTDSDYASSTLVRLLDDTELVMMDIAPLEDAYSGPGMLAAMGPASGGRWPGAELDRSLDDVSFQKVLDTASAATMGSAETTLGDFTGGNVFDEVNTLTVDVGEGTLASSTRDALLITASENAMAVGNNENGWEVIKFRTASLLSPGVYVLSGLLRGLRGTEWAMAGHAAGEIVVLLDAASLRHVAHTAADRNIPYYWKAVTFGKSRSDADSEVATDTGVSLKPFAPVHLRYDRAAQLVTWHRRSRLASRFLDTVDVPLGESVEAYDVELRDAADVLVDSATVSEPAYAASSLVEVDNLVAPVSEMKDVSGTRVAITKDGERLAAFDAVGLISEQTDLLGTVAQWCNNGTTCYVVSFKLTNTVPQLFTDNKIERYTLGTLATPDATNTAAALGDYQGVAFDGTSVWVTEWTSGNLRKLNATTLASVSAHAIAGGPYVLQYDGAGKLWVMLVNSGEIARWDAATATEDFRVSVSAEVGTPTNIFLAGTSIFVFGVSGVAVYARANGALVLDHPGISSPFGGYGRGATEFGSDVVFGAMAPSESVVFLDATTGARTNTLAWPVDYPYAVAGSDGVDLYLTGSEGAGFSYQTLIYNVAPVNLTGYSVTVWQKSAAVGRGYPAILEL